MYLLFNNYMVTSFFCNFDLYRNANSFVHPLVVSQQTYNAVSLSFFFVFSPSNDLFLLDMLDLHILFIRFGGVDQDFDFGVILPKTPLSFLLWKLTPKMRNLLSTAAPHQGPGPPDLFLSFVPFSLFNQRLWVGIQNKF